VATVGALFALGADTPEARLGIAIGAAVALVLQPAMFAVARSMQGSGQWLAGWGIGAIACGAALVAVGVALRAAGPPTGAPMLALATALFVTELVEPLLLQS
jgi:hypothetical protein